jgi:hypothetical protein
MSRRVPTTGWLPLLLLLAAAGAIGCGNTNSSNASTGSGGTGDQDAGADAGAVGGMDGAISGLGGAVGSGGAAAGAGGAAAGTGGSSGTGGAPAPCAVQIKPVSSVDLDGLPAGPNATLRVRGVITGTPQPAQPDWRWSVSTVTDNRPIPVTPDPQDPALVQFPLASADRYDITVTVSNAPVCGGHEIATATFNPSASYWLRISAPADQVEVPPHEETIKLQAGQPLQRSFYFDRGAAVSLDPKTSSSQALTSYVRISSPGHSWTREGDTELAAFGTSIVDTPASLYDVLVVPLAPADAPFAPLLFSGRTAARVAALSIVVDPGVPVGGTLRAAGAAVAGATIALRAGDLPSTIGTSDAAGAFGLLARPGRFSALIIAPDGAALPDAHVDASDASGLDLPAAVGGALSLAFVWRSDLGSATLAAQFVTSAGAPAAALDVRLESDPEGDPTTWGDVGTLQANGGPGGAQSLVAAGSLRRAATTDARGAISFSGLPAGGYRLIALPPVASNDGLTVTAVDVVAGLPTVAVTLAPKVTVSGRLLGASPGTRLLILDDQPTLGRSFPAAAVGSDGAYTLNLDPSHAYHLLSDPPAGQMNARVALGPIESGDVALALGDRVLPAMLSVSGRVFAPDGQTPVAGALLQLFCMGAGPDCVDYSQLDAGHPLPLFEATTDALGVFTLFAPDPASR